MPNLIDGLHLMADGMVPEAQVERAFSKVGLTTLMLEIVKVLEMELIMGPVFKKVRLDPRKLTGDVFQDEGGVSGFCMIGTSHISVHVWPLRRHFSMDVFSCRPFDERSAKEAIDRHMMSERTAFQSARRIQGGMSSKKVRKTQARPSPN